MSPVPGKATQLANLPISWPQTVVPYRDCPGGYEADSADAVLMPGQFRYGRLQEAADVCGGTRQAMGIECVFGTCRG
jgi:hypothetical protein